MTLADVFGQKSRTFHGKSAPGRWIKIPKWFLVEHIPTWLTSKDRSGLCFMFVSGLGFKFLIGNLYLQTTSLTNLSAVTLTYLENPFPAGSSRVPFDTKSDSDILCLQHCRPPHLHNRHWEGRVIEQEKLVGPSPTHGLTSTYSFSRNLGDIDFTYILTYQIYILSTN